MSESGSGEPVSDSRDNDKEPSVWVCRDCGKEYGSRQGLAYHYKTDTNECSGFPCLECDKDHFVNRKGVALHHGKQHGGQMSLYDKLDNREWFYQKYVIEGYSTAGIAELVGCSRPQASAWKRKHGIESITSYKSRGTGKDSPSYNPDSWVETECEWCGEEMEIRRKRYNTSENNFCNTECSNNWRSEYWVKENNPLYKGGPVNYGSKWHAARQDRLEYDDHQCQRCLTEENLEVHHTRPVRDFEDAEDAHFRDNLVTLCRSCHRAWEGIPVKPTVSD